MIAWLLAVGADVGRHVAGAAARAALSGIFFLGEVPAIEGPQQGARDAIARPDTGICREGIQK
jgi:hypothetical protein